MYVCMYVQSSLTCTCFDVAANKNPHNFSGRARDTGKLKKRRQFLTPKKTKGMRYRLTTSSRVTRAEVKITFRFPVLAGWTCD